MEAAWVHLNNEGTCKLTFADFVSLGFEGVYSIEPPVADWIFGYDC